MRLVIVGGDAAGMSAATHVRRACPESHVTVVERGPHTSYSMCGIPYYIGGLLDHADDLVVRTPAQFRDEGITVHVRTEAIAIDPDARTVRVRDLDAAGRPERDLGYDALLWAAGAHPAVPDLPGLRRYGHVVHTLDEAEHLRAHLEAHTEIDRVVVVGSGYVGLEIAEALVERGIGATIIDRSQQVMKTIDADLALLVQQQLEARGMGMRLGESVVAVRGEDGRCQTVVTDRGAYPADTVVLAMGHRPNVDIPAAAGCRLGPTGALVVDPQMRTTVDGIWAAGDCVESADLVAGMRVNVQLGTHANKQGKVAGIVIAGGEAAFPGVVGTAVTRLCDWEIARTGLSVAEADKLDLDYAAVTFTGTAKAGYMPDAGVVHVRMLAERATGRVLGVQLLGTGGVAKRIDVAAVWCQLGVTVQQAQLLDLSYAPPFGGVWDLLQVAARKLTRELGLRPQL